MGVELLIDIMYHERNEGLELSFALVYIISVILYAMVREILNIISIASKSFL